MTFMGPTPAPPRVRGNSDRPLSRYFTFCRTFLRIVNYPLLILFFPVENNLNLASIYSACLLVREEFFFFRFWHDLFKSVWTPLIFLLLAALIDVERILQPLDVSESIDHKNQNKFLFLLIDRIVRSRKRSWERKSWLFSSFILVSLTHSQHLKMSENCFMT